MPTNPQGPGTVNITVNVPQELKEEIDKLTKRKMINRSAFIRAAIAEKIKRLSK
jgi:metal-responsive CopG/Arc/MetJ family transcriptional regulator